ncbi:MAG: glycosyltransferase [Nitrospirota bacterium]
MSQELITMSQERKPKVLISAYACEPNKGSEPGVGWNWAKQIARFADTWVITRANNRNVIEEELRKNPDPNLHFIYYDVPKWLTFWKRGKRGVHLYYALWQLGAYRLARKSHRQNRFAIVHHLTFGNIWLPTLMPFLVIPFIWGPLGGGEHIPAAFRQSFDCKSKIRETLRDVMVLSLKANLLFLHTCKKANRILAKTGDTASRIPFQYSKRVLVTTDVAVSSRNIDADRKNNMQIIAVGSLETWRGFDLLLKAFSAIVQKYEGAKLLILGDGGDRKRLQQICEEENISQNVHFAGQVSAAEYLEYMGKSAIFVNPSLKEGGVTVLFDALSIGLPVICLDVPGASEIVTEECGIKIKPVNPEQTIHDLSDAIIKLASDSDLRRKMGEAGRKRVGEHYTWEKKGEFIKKIYEEVMGERL